VPHVVPSDLEANSVAPHQAGMHGAETAEINSPVYPELLSDGLDMSVKQVVSIERLTGPVGKHQVVWLAVLFVAGPHSLYRRENDAMLVEWHLALTGFSFHIVELIIVDTFVQSWLFSEREGADRGSPGCPHRGKNFATRHVRFFRPPLA
jgi:hypothetical protein